MSKRLCCILLIAFAVVLFTPAVWGQATGSFSGTVTDKSGSAVSWCDGDGDLARHGSGTRSHDR